MAQSLKRMAGFPRLRAAIRGLAFTLLLALAACGGPESAEVQAPEVTETERAARELQIADLEAQVAALARQSESVRREVIARLDQIDATRGALEVQLAALRGEAVGAPAESTATAVEPPAAVPAAEPGAPPAAAQPETSPSERRPLLRFVLLVFILAAIFFLGRIFFDRWGDPEDGEKPPYVETTTDLGKIRVPPGTQLRRDDVEFSVGNRDDDDDEDPEGRPGD